MSRLHRCDDGECEQRQRHDRMALSSSYRDQNRPAGALRRRHIGNVSTSEQGRQSGISESLGSYGRHVRQQRSSYSAVHVSVS